MEIWKSSIENAIKQTDENIAFYENYKRSHEELIKNLKTYNESLEIPILVPICSRVLMRGNLIHTNEILASIGCNYFVKSSSKQARDICQRRVTGSENILKELEKERTFLTNQIGFSQNIFSPEGEEIVESYDEEAEKEWREKRHSKLIAHRKKEAEELNKINDQDLIDKLDMLELEEDMAALNREANKGHKENGSENVDREIISIKEKLYQLRNKDKVKCVTEKDVYDRLDQLEEEEELEEKLEQLGGNVSDSDDESDNNLFESEDDELDHMDQIKNYDHNNKKIKYKGIDSKPVEVKKKRVIFAKEISVEEPESNTLMINFKHTDCPGVPENSSNSLESPSDIYKLFPHQMPTKSIIKNQHKVTEEIHLDETYKDKEKKAKIPMNIDVIGDVVEKVFEQPKVTTVDSNQQRPISKFKSMKMSRNKNK